ncbi:hypothetical protein AB670_04052 [Chryseobacterium sp. MOF25P]|nr:hypothetical protein AB670_04052 [Chryseobacterium sp. MOF25P]OBW43666.1 hypothetical protein AB671_04242 [Chryseobacterium sp. BGARF1]
MGEITVPVQVFGWVKELEEIKWQFLDKVVKVLYFRVSVLAQLPEDADVDLIGMIPDAVNPQNGNFNEYLTYDLNGNILSLKRNAPQVFSPTATMVDDLDYQYIGNRLNRVIENALNDTGYEGGNNFIAYDVNGNMTNMLDKGIQRITYNYLNLPDNISINQNSPFGVQISFGLEYLYRADGTKLRKKHSTGGGKGQSTTNNITDYLDGFQYSLSETIAPCEWCRTEVAFEEQAFKKDIIIGPIGPLDPPLLSGLWNLDFVPTAEGFYSFAENRYIYQYRDHLGNARLSFAKKVDGSLEVTDKNDYYPFGLNHIGGSKSLLGGYKNYKYNGKELQETGMYDYGARFYMPDIGRWGVVDPLAEKYTRMSPYTYAGNNPAMFVDYDGRDYGVYVDLKAGTVTVKATYHAVANDMASLNGAIKTWNDSSGKYNYIYKGADGKDISLKVNFELSSSTVTQNENESRYDALNRVLNSDQSGEGNTYRVNNDSDFEENEKGYTEEGKSIAVKKSESDSKKGTGAHEIGHTLNILDGGGVMGSSNSSSINSQHVKEILSAIGGTPQNPTKSTPRPNHSATIHLENNNLKTNDDYKKLRNGKVKSAE